MYVCVCVMRVYVCACTCVCVYVCVCVRVGWGSTGLGSKRHERDGEGASGCHDVTPRRAEQSVTKGVRRVAIKSRLINGRPLNKNLTNNTFGRV